MIRAFDWRKRKGTHLASRHAVVVLFLLMWSTCLVAQPVINTDTLSVENLVNQVLLGGNLQATNITYQGLPDQFGLLTGGQDFYGFEEGIVLSTNSAGADADCSESGANELDYSQQWNPLVDPEIWGLIEDLTPAGVFQLAHDAAILEFDIQPVTDDLEFRFVFATNESVPFEDPIRFDLFALFVSGPGIAGPFANGAENLALLPSGEVLSNKASGLAMMGNTPISEEGCWDFYTVPIEAHSDVICGESYHVKMVVIEAQDPTENTAVLFERGNMESDDLIGIDWLMDWQTVDSPILYEGCGEGQLIFTRPANAGLGLLELQVLYSNGTDGTADLTDASFSTALPELLVFPPGVNQVIWNVEGVSDANAAEGVEPLILEFIHTDGCASGSASSFFTISIADSPDPLELASTNSAICEGEGILLEPDVSGGAGNYQFEWCDGSTGSTYEWFPAASSSCLLTVTDTCGVADAQAIFDVAVYPVPEMSAGSDELLCPGQLMLDGAFLNLQPAFCPSEAGDYSHCYADLQDFSQTHCPDLQGTYMELTFTDGDFSFGDYVQVFDGTDVLAPELDPFAGGFQLVPGGESVAGTSFQATNPTGCLTVLFSSTNNSNSCATGQNNPIDYTIACNNLSGWELQWSPGLGLSDSTILQPLIDLQSAMALELSVTMAGAPFCTSSDSVYIAPSFDAAAEGVNPTCFDPDGEITLAITPIGSAGPWDVAVTYAAGVLFSETTNDLSFTFNGLYADTYEISVSDANCTFEETITLLAQPEVTIALEADTTICLGGAAILEAIPSYNEPSLQWVWSNGFPGTTQSVSPIETTVYSVYASLFPGCNTDTWEVTVSVRDSLAFTLPADANLCLGDSLLLLASSLTGGLEPYALDWDSNSPAEELLDDTLMQWVAPPVPTQFCLTLSDACETPVFTECVEIYVPNDETADFESDVISGCFPLVVEFTGTAQNPGQIASEEWLFGDGLSSADIQTTSHAYIDVGLYTVEHTITTIYGCTFSMLMEDLIRVSPWPVAEFAASPWEQTLPDRRVEFLNYSLGALTYEWHFDFLDTSDEYGPEYYFPDDAGGVYDITLVATNEWGCSDSISHPLWIIDDFVMYVPNVFTPDNDGVNDAWQVIGRDVDPADYTLVIHDRWGEEVFTSNNIDDVWLGNHQGGTHYAANGVYFYTIVARSLSTAVRHELKGHINLLR